jgi:hypothetical protein
MYKVKGLEEKNQCVCKIYAQEGWPKIKLWLGIYSPTNCGLGGSGGTLIWVPPVYPQGTAGSAVGFGNNSPNQTRSCLITSINQTMSHHLKLVKHETCKQHESKSNTQLAINT